MIQPCPAVSFPISVLRLNIPNNKDKIYLVSDYSFCCRDICRNIQVQEKNCLKSQCCLNGQDRTYQLFWSLICCSFSSWLFLVPYGGGRGLYFSKNGVSYISSFWGLDYYQGCKIELSWVKEVVFFFIKSVYFLKFIILKVKGPCLRLTNCQTYHFSFFFYYVDPFFSLFL